MPAVAVRRRDYRCITIERVQFSRESLPMNRSGIVLIVIGSLFLAHNFGLLEFGWLRQWWPLILIGLGVWSLVNHKPGERHRSSGEQQEKP